MRSDSWLRPGAGSVGAGPAALLGLGAVAAGLGIGQLAATFGAAASSPVLAVSAVAVDLTPRWLKEFATSTFGTRDKAVLLGVALAVVALLGAAVGVVAARSRVLGGVLLAGFTALGMAAALSRPPAGPSWALPSVLAGLVTGGLFLGTLARLAGELSSGLARRSGDRRAAEGPDRRAVLRVAGGAAVLGLAGALAGRGVAMLRGGVSAARAALRLPAPASSAPSAAGATEVGVPGVVPFLVPNRRFYRIDTALVVPQVSPDSWRLRVHGMVAREVVLTWAELLAGPLVERDLTLACVSNPVGGDLVGNARWLGLPLAPLLRRAGPAADADMVLSTSVDGWTAGTPLAVLLDGRDALLAVGMNGVPLPVEHGFPVRLVVPGLYGYVSATKWVVDLEVTRFDRAEGYWTPRGWSPLGPVKTSSRIDVPRDGDRLRPGRVPVAGVAWAQHRGVRSVQVRVDDGPWQEARTAAVPSADTWRQWVLDWQATSGSHALSVRAVDGPGAVQIGEPTDAAPDGATGWHTITVHVG